MPKEFPDLWGKVSIIRVTISESISQVNYSKNINSNTVCPYFVSDSIVFFVLDSISCSPLNSPVRLVLTNILKY